MKKSYMKPSMSIVKVYAMGMIASSPTAEMYGKNAESAGLGKSRGSRSGDADFDELW